MIRERAVGEKIRGHRLQRELSARELARRAGVATSTITHAEHSEHTPRLDNLKKIARALGVDLIDLL